MRYVSTSALRSRVILFIIVMSFYMIHSSTLYHSEATSEALVIENIWVQNYYVLSKPGYLLVEIRSSTSIEESTHAVVDVEPFRDTLELLRVNKHSEVTVRLPRSDSSILLKILNISFVSNRAINETCIAIPVKITLKDPDRSIIFDSKPILVTLCTLDYVSYLVYVREDLKGINVLINSLTSIVNSFEERIRRYNESIRKLDESLTRHMYDFNRSITDLSRSIDSVEEGMKQTRIYVNTILAMNVALIVVIGGIAVYLFKKRRNANTCKDVELMGL